MLLDLLLRLRDRGAAVREDVQPGEELVEAAFRSGADTEEREGQREEQGEQDVDELRLAPQAHEEELLIRVAARCVAAATRRAPLRSCLRRLLLRLLLGLDRRACHGALRVPLAEPRPAASRPGGAAP